MTDLNVLHSCLSEGFGGLEKFFLQSSHHMDERFNLHLLIKSNSGLEERLKDTDLSYETLSFFNYLDLKSMWQIRKIVTSRNIDVVYFQGSSELGLIVPATIGLDVKIVNRKSILVTSSKKDFYHRLIYNGVDTFIAPTPGTRENLLEKYPVEEQRIEVVPNALELGEFMRSEHEPILSSFLDGSKGNRRYVTTVSRLVPEKGIKTFVEVAKEVTRKRDDIVFFVVGTGPNDFLTELKESAPDRIKNQIIFTGFQEDVPSVLDETDLFVSFAEMETFGNNLAEAKAMNLPMLTYPTSAAKFHLDKHPEFIVSKDSSLEELSQRVIELLQDEHEDLNYDIDHFKFGHYLGELDRIFSN